MRRVVQAPDGRKWSVRSTVNWSAPATDHEFEHDIAAGQVGGIAMLVVIVVLVVTVVLWTPAGVVVPTWLVLGFILLLMIIPLQWAMARPWTIVADTAEPAETEGEHWVGTVTGLLNSRREAARVVRLLAGGQQPDDGRGPLQPVN